MGEAKQRLVLEVEALGFKDAASSVEVLEAAQKRLIENAKELEEAKSSGVVQQVADLTKEQERLSFVVGNLKGKQQGLNESHGHFERVLRSVHPALGEVAALLERYGGAASIAAATIMGMSSAVRMMREELAQSTKAIADQAKALNEIKRNERVQQQSIEDTRAGSKLGPFKSAAESDEAFKTFQRIREKFPFIEESAVGQAVAFTGGDKGGLFGGGFDIDEIARLARLLQLHNPSRQIPRPALALDEKTRAGSVQGRIGRALERNREALDTEFRVEAEQAKARSGRSALEVQQEGGSTLNLRERIERRAPAGANIDALVKLAQRLGGPEELEAFAKNLEMAESGISPTLHVGRRVGQGLQGLGVIDDPKVSATQQDLAILLGVLNEIAVEQRRQEEEDKRKPGTPVSINYNNSKFVVPGATYQRSARVNDESFARDAEFV